MNRNDRSIVTLVMVAHSMVHTYELSIPILVEIWLAQFGVTAATMGLVVTAGYALFGLGAIPGGVLADAIGSRSLIVACLAGMSVSFLLLSASPTLPVIALALLVWGAAASVYHPSGLSLISTGVRERGSAFAYHGIAGNLGIAFGPLATAVMLLFFDWRYVTAILAIPAALAALFALQVTVDEKAAVEATDGGESKADAGVSSLAEFVAESKVLFAGAFVFVFGVVILSGLYYRGVLTFLPVVLSQFDLFQPVEVAGRTLEPYRYFYAGLLMVGVFGQYTGGKLTDRVPTEYGIAIAFAVLAVLALAFLPASNAGLGAFLVVGGLLGFFLFVVQPLYQATVAEYTPAGTRGLSYGYTYLGVFGVGSLGATIAGGLLSVSASALFLALAGFATAAAGLGAYLSLR